MEQETEAEKEKDALAVGEEIVEKDHAHQAVPAAEKAVDVVKDGIDNKERYIESFKAASGKT